MVNIKKWIRRPHRTKQYQVFLETLKKWYDRPTKIPQSSHVKHAARGPLLQAYLRPSQRIVGNFFQSGGEETSNYEMCP